MNSYFTRKQFPFMLVGTVRGGEPYTDVRTTKTWIEKAVVNYLENPYLGSVGPCVVHVWSEDLEATRAQLSKYADRGVSVAAIEPIAQDLNSRALAFAEGYKKLVLETGFDLGHSPCIDEDYLQHLDTPKDKRTAANRGFQVLKALAKEAK